ncbi:helix-turn-helix domain-containing protein [Microbulbifer salipaludis]|uniref:Helix-turn-helix domain-containing protein n=1 Tax=Microbulbifer salipaludis TaxID=187980 RepID=A0ABS3E968_9GAMM|nr:Cro/CI family transcriptional regulator [Microbulbifer salipaludis]MBN8431829.1 helix-turn-helix domain-containing protein [Microbulbifer salipaludis]
MSEAIEDAIKHFGSAGELARQAGVTSMAVSHWKKRGIPVVRALQIDLLTNGQVSKECLRPDIFHPQDAQNDSGVAESSRKAS